MKISGTAYANPVADFFNVISDIAENKSLATIAKESVDILDAEIVNDIRPKTAKIPDIDEAARSALSKSDEALASGFSAIQRADQAIDQAQEAKILSDAAIDNATSAINKADDALGKAGTALNNGLDLFDRVANIFNLIATLGTIARMEQIAANSRARDEELNAKLDYFISGLIGINAKNEDQDASLSRLFDFVNQLYASIQELYRLLSGIETMSSADLAALNSAIATLTQTVTSGFNNLPPQVKTAVCEALSDCFEYPDFSNIEQKIDNLLDDESDKGLSEVLRRIGAFPNNCGQQSISHALCGGGAGGGDGFNLQEALEDFFANNETCDLQPVIDKIESKGNQIIDVIEEIEVVASVPENWQVRVGADRPQLIVSYAETLTGGKIGRSRYPLTIPHWNGLKKWDLLPKWTKGNTQARLILKDNSRVYIYASSESMAIATMNKVIKFIDPSMIGNKTPFVGKANISIKPLKVEPCTAKFYAKGQKTEIPDFYQIRIKPKTT